MNTSLVKSAPQGCFAEVSALKHGWQDQIELLISQKEPIAFDMYPQPGIPPSVISKLDQEGYSDLVLHHDQWQHFLVPSQTGRSPHAARDVV